ncbi:MAG: TetR/AcrR family transcriptional regulator [Hahellaceae bacterium]|nr:TetR/AcrR family transcriptional regulator [Hahellaceae bacterium]
MAGGRKLEFDKETALEAAMHVFWKKGYSGASLADLTESMGINKPSLYATFGNKEALFIQATEYYVEHVARTHCQYLVQEGIPLRDRLKNYLMSVVASQCDSSKPKGCYVALCASEAAGDSIPDHAQETLFKAGAYTQNALMRVFTDDTDAIRLLSKSCSSAEETVRFLFTLLNGTAAMARVGLSLAELESVVEHGLRGIGL